MAEYTIMVLADAEGTAHRITVNAPTPWLAVERTRERIGPFGAYLYEGKRCLAAIDKSPGDRDIVWEISRPGEA